MAAKKTATKKTAAKTTQDIVVEFEFDRETKNTYRFAEVGDDGVIGTLYVQKSAFVSAPDALTVTIAVS